MANFPAIEVPHAGMSNGKYGPHFECVTGYDHGWPLRYAERDASRPVKAPAPRGPYWERASAWTPWAGTKSFYWTALLIDAATALSVVAIGAVMAQLWRSRRRSILQPRLIDLLGLVAFVAAACAWIGHDRLQRLNEERLLRVDAEQRGDNYVNLLKHVERGCAVPAFLPKSMRDWYESRFGNVLELNGDVDLAPQFRHLLVLAYPPVSQSLRDCLRRLPNLEAIDWCRGSIHHSGAPDDIELRDLPPLRNLRGVNLYDTDANDRDLEWLGKCPRLERICLFDTEVTDVGMWHLAHLNRLRILEVESEYLTDEACKACAKIISLEELSLASDKITDSGVEHLRPLRQLKSLHVFSDLLTNESCNTIAGWSNLEIVILESTEISDAGALAFARSFNLKRLQIRAPVSDAAAAKLKTLLPNCEVDVWH